jgi:hypothetical protein
MKITDKQLHGARMQRHDENLSMESFYPPIYLVQVMWSSLQLVGENRICFCTAASLKEVYFFLCNVRGHKTLEKPHSRRQCYSFAK